VPDQPIEEHDMTRSVSTPVVPAPRTSPEATAARGATGLDQEGTVRVPRPAAEYWDVTEARWRRSR
jgi:hypothetical protein